jgi:pyruvate-formate lyase-activating enzyme
MRGVDSDPARAAPRPSLSGRLIVDPSLHVGEDRIYHPLTDRTLTVEQSEFSLLRELMAGIRDLASLPDSAVRNLREGGWLVDRGSDLWRRFRLKYASLETHTSCNQACFFCPVSIAPRAAHAMPSQLFTRIVSELAAYRETLEGVFLMSYNEPTLDKRFVEQCRALMEAGLPAAVNSNGSGLTPARVDALLEHGSLRFLSINLSTLDRQKYRRDRGADQLDQVLRNLDYAQRQPVAEEMVIVVLGDGDEDHCQEVEAIQRRFAGGRFEVQAHRLMDRAGYLDVGIKPSSRDRPLRGCENLGSRPLQHLHITPQGRCVLCCEDYGEQNVVGDLNTSTIHEVLTGPTLARMRRWAYGQEEAPSDFICRDCVFAL